MPELKLLTPPKPHRWSSTPARRLVVLLCCNVLIWGAVVATANGREWVGLVAFLFAASCQWAGVEADRW